jgi:hypothetical protein
MALDSVKAFTGDVVIYIGEWCSGMTASTAFHAHLLDNFALERTVELPCWAATNYELRVYRRHDSKRKGKGDAKRKKVDKDVAMEPDASTSPMWQCDACATGFRLDQASGLRRCRVTRKLLLCKASAKCAKGSQVYHRALKLMEHQPSLAVDLEALAFEKKKKINCHRLGSFGPVLVTTDNEREWSSLAEATPNERGKN